MLRYLVTALALSLPSIRRTLKLSLGFEAESLRHPLNRRKRPSASADASGFSKAAKCERTARGGVDAAEAAVEEAVAAEASGESNGHSVNSASVWRLKLTFGTAGVGRCPFAEQAVVELPWPHRPADEGDAPFASKPIVLLTQPFQSVAVACCARHLCTAHTSVPAHSIPCGVARRVAVRCICGGATASALGPTLAEVSVPEGSALRGVVAVRFAVNEYLRTKWAAKPVELSCSIDLECISGAPTVAWRPSRRHAPWSHHGWLVQASSSSTCRLGLSSTECMRTSSALRYK